MKKLLIVLLLAMALLTACGTADSPEQAADTGRTVTVYYSPT